MCALFNMWNRFPLEYEGALAAGVGIERMMISTWPRLRRSSGVTTR
ncbi:hypothetical protein [Capillimicrobium parvum]|uniref:Uncharacterized protein n=1 Tax=Capillimicrobium parvum TaxID=2884022 RepID=A0A9E7BZU9_9ACTN|nr:hypothetical protein [Capillimicrobium parvum]UGS34949.1 hypothetical protein DSM104329_01333 [Capillimicrobium parvum]